MYSSFLCLFLLATCNSSTNQGTNVDTTTHVVKVADSSKENLKNALGDLIKSNTSPGDTTIKGRYVSQENIITEISI